MTVGFRHSKLASRDSILGGRSCQRRLLRLPLWLVVLGLTLGSVEARALNPSLPEYRVKAAFLFHFLQFVEWPANAFPDETSPITLCILGDDPFGPVLDQTVGDKTVGNRRIVIRRCQRIEDAGSCHLLFVSRSEIERLPQILARQQGVSSLTVGETDQFVQLCGIINFTVEEGQVRFEINPNAAQRAGVRISSRLLRLAKVVRTECPGPRQ